ncbi:MAG: RtcB family protein [Sphingomonas sp.]
MGLPELPDLAVPTYRWCDQQCDSRIGGFSRHALPCEDGRPSGSATPRPRGRCRSPITSPIRRAYKPIEAVMAAQADLVEIVHTLKQVVCVKG